MRKKYKTGEFLLTFSLHVLYLIISVLGLAVVDEMLETTTSPAVAFMPVVICFMLSTVLAATLMVSTLIWSLYANR